MAHDSDVWVAGIDDVDTTETKTDDNVNLKVDEVDNASEIIDNATQEQNQVIDKWVAEAQKEGWKPKEEYTGNPDNWVDAEEYVKRGKLLKPLKEKVTELERTMSEERKRMMDAMRDIQIQTQERARAEYEAKIAQINAAKKQAFEAGDYERFNAADAAHRELDNKMQVRNAPAVDPEIDAWVRNTEVEFQQNNPWYNTDPERTRAAEEYIEFQVHKAMAAKQGRGEVAKLTPTEFKGVLDSAAKMFGQGAHAPSQAAARTPPVVAPASNARPPAASKQMRFSDLPAEDQATFRAFQRKGIYKNTGNIDKDAAQFLKDYNNDSPYVVG